MIVLQLNPFLAQASFECDGEISVEVCAKQVDGHWLVSAAGKSASETSAPVVWLGSARDAFSPREFASLDSVWSVLDRAMPPGALLLLHARRA